MIHTECHYAELSGDWIDGDLLVGEFIDDFSAGDPDVFGVSVGRIPFYNIGDLDHILAKIITYEMKVLLLSNGGQNAYTSNLLTTIHQLSFCRGNQ